LAKSILKKNVGIGTVITKNNWKVLDQIIKDGADAGASMFTLLCLILTGRADNTQNPTLCFTFRKIFGYWEGRL